MTHKKEIMFHIKITYTYLQEYVGTFNFGFYLYQFPAKLHSLFSKRSRFLFERMLTSNSNCNIQLTQNMYRYFWPYNPNFSR